MSRHIPPALLAHLQQQTTTTCRLLLFTFRDGTTFGMTNLDRPVVYKGVTYWSALGFDASVIATDDELSVSNADMTSILADVNGNGVTYNEAVAGRLDDAQWRLLLINYESPDDGEIIIDAGDVGEVKITDGVAYIPELLSYAMRLKQTIGTAWSRRCRAVFGSPANSQFGCGVDVSGMWQSAAVDAVDPDDAHRVFRCDALIGGTDYFPGRVEWVSGDNASQRLAVIEAMSTVSGTVVLMEPLGFAIRPGDTFRIRRDCNKSPSHCLGYGNMLNYKGEPYIPVGDGLNSMVPRAQVFGGLSGSAIVD